MKAETKLFTLLGAFFAACGIAYGLVTGWDEPVGVVALLLSAGLGAMISFFLWKAGKDLPPRPDDSPDGEIADQAGDYGEFAPYSWWPLWLGLSGAIIFLGVAVGFWVFFLGAVFGVYALVGWVFEYYQGEHAS
ncbi:cytochrome c oxidase subunit 4 [Janibacter alkaliphilus]|uniref:Cytochrome c oxidase polypeptide 4 n=1 Tax=Janibacter alkaliphilus TaxID=1069963 RepID=A0A852XHH6_9MICO|nr:cytochrome c oxidase subunit 4 [Janibacter alkaliphilus]NYG37851.1 hypothetical protein [Janibacter alkaliphilus]